MGLNPQNHRIARIEVYEYLAYNGEDSRACALLSGISGCMELTENAGWILQVGMGIRKSLLPCNVLKIGPPLLDGLLSILVDTKLTIIRPGFNYGRKGAVMAIGEREQQEAEYFAFKKRTDVFWKSVGGYFELPWEWHRWWCTRPGFQGVVRFYVSGQVLPTVPSVSNL